MIISPVYLTLLLVKMDGMTQREKKFRLMAHRCEQLSSAQAGTIFFDGI
jgi:hypothetical protein